MADGTHIEWTDATWNVVNGCSVHTPGCTNCYAMKLAGTRLRNHPSRAGLTRETKAGPVWTGEVRFNEKVLTDPLKWRRPRRIFVCAHGDLFHENVPDEWIDRVFAVMALAPQHQFQVLTKRADRMRKYVTDRARMDWLNAELEQVAEQANVSSNCVCRCDDDDGDIKWPLPNVWLGVSVEDQARADERIPDLLATPAAVRWLSCEPLLGPVNLTRVRDGYVNALVGIEGLGTSCLRDINGLDWIVVGGESGPGARPMHPDWARSLRDECAAAGVPFLFKQWGEFAPGEIAGDYLDPEKAAKGYSLFDGRWDECWSEVEGHCDDEPDVYRISKKLAGRLLDGVQHDGFPA